MTMSEKPAKIRFVCEGGSETICRTFSLALVYWYGQGNERILPQPYSVKFMPAIIAKMGNRFGKVPDDLRSYPDTPAEAGEGELWEFDVVEEKFEGGDIEVVKYENHCFQLLQWLVNYGDIVTLEVDGVRWRNPSKKFRSIDDAWESS